MHLSSYLPSFVRRYFNSDSTPPARDTSTTRAPVLAHSVSDSLDLEASSFSSRSSSLVSDGLAPTVSRGPRPIVPTNTSAPAFYPELEDLLAMKAVERDTTMRGVELRFYDPRGIIAAYALNPGYAETSCKDVFNQLLRTKQFGPSCGETSNALKGVLFSGTVSEKEGEDELYQAIRAEGDGFLRVQIGCHSFVIEKKNDTCRIFQSYDGWYSMATSLKDDHPIEKHEFAAMVQAVVRKDQATTQKQFDAAERAEETLFHGEVDATRNARGSRRYQIVTETSAHRTEAKDVGARLDALLDRYDDVWNAFENETSVSVGDFAKSQWPELFGL